MVHTKFLESIYGHSETILHFETLLGRLFCKEPLENIATLAGKAVIEQVKGLIRDGMSGELALLAASAVQIGTIITADHTRWFPIIEVGLCSRPSGQTDVRMNRHHRVAIPVLRNMSAQSAFSAVTQAISRMRIHHEGTDYTSVDVWDAHVVAASPAYYPAEGRARHYAELGKGYDCLSLVDNGIIAGDFSQLYNNMQDAASKLRKFAQRHDVSHATAGAVLLYADLTLRKRAGIEEAYKMYIDSYKTKFDAACAALSIADDITDILNHDATIAKAFPVDSNNVLIEAIDGTYALFIER